MKLTAQVKLVVTPEQADALRETLVLANAACNTISDWAWQNQVFGQFALHGATYKTIRETFPLAAQVVVRCNAKVADAYKLDKKTKRVFAPTGAIAYDERILRWQVERSAVSLWTVKGRMTLPFVCGDRQRELLATQQGETDLCCIGPDGLARLRGIWFLNAICNVEEPPAFADVSGGFRRAGLRPRLGIDLGIVNLATDSEGRQYSGEAVKSLRRRPGHLAAKCLSRLRSGLQHQAKKHKSQPVVGVVTAPKRIESPNRISSVNPAASKDNADCNAARNIAKHGATVTCPMDGTIASLSPLSKPPALAGA